MKETVITLEQQQPSKLILHKVFCDIDRNNVLNNNLRNSSNNNNNNVNNDGSGNPNDSCSDLSDSKKNQSRFVEFLLQNSNYLMTVTFVLFLILSSYLLRDYIHSVLRWIESQPDALVFVILVVLYTLVSLPIAWGYIIINIATGYMYGIVNGTLVTLVTATLGIFFAHHIMKRFLVQYIQKILQATPSKAGSTLRSVSILLASPSHAFKLVALSRLTPIPFGLQNSVFALSSLSTLKYLQATCLGLLPCQIVNVYLGSTLRSMEEVLDGSQSATVAIVALAFQVIVAVVLVAFVVRKAQTELDRAVDVDMNDPETADPAFEAIFMSDKPSSH